MGTNKYPKGENVRAHFLMENSMNIKIIILCTKILTWFIVITILPGVIASKLEYFQNTEFLELKLGIFCVIYFMGLFLFCCLIKKGPKEGIILFIMSSTSFMAFIVMCYVSLITAPVRIFKSGEFFRYLRSYNCRSYKSNPIYYLEYKR